MSPREWSVLILLANRAGKFVPSDFILAKVWPDLADIHNVPSTIARIRPKLPRGYRIEGKQHQGYRLVVEA